MLHELIADKDATIPKICARTGMALRTINNALATLRGAGILKARGNGIVGDCEGERAKKQPIKSEGQPIEGEKPHIGSRKPHIGSEKPHIGSEKPHIGSEKPHIGDEKPSIEPGKPSIEDLALKYGLTRPTSENIHKLLCAFGSHIVFGRSMIMAETGLEITAAGVLIKTMLQHRLLDTVRGYGKGKYRFRTTVLT